MAKAYFYECVVDCDLGVLGPLSKYQRSWYEARTDDPDDIPQQTLHSLRILARVDGKGEKRYGMAHGNIIKTDKPLARSYTESIEKLVSRPLISSQDPHRQFKRLMRAKTNPIHFRLLAADEVSLYTESVAIYPGEHPDGKVLMGKKARWAPSLFEESATEVQLPEEAAKLLRSVQAMVTPTGDGSLESPEGA